MNKCGDKIKAKITELAMEMESTKKPSELGQSIFDRIISHNMQCTKEGREEERFSNDEIAGNIFLFQFAGSDSSNHTSINTLCYLAKNMDI